MGQLNSARGDKKLMQTTRILDSVYACMTQYILIWTNQCLTLE